MGFWELSGTLILDGFGFPHPDVNDFSAIIVSFFDNDDNADVLFLDTTNGQLITWNMGVDGSGDIVIAFVNFLGNPGAGLVVSASGDIDCNGNGDLLYRFGSGPTASVAASLMTDDGAGNLTINGANIGTLDENWAIVLNPG
jgi:hypothetical protein